MNKTELLQSILNQSDPGSEYYDGECDNYLFDVEYRPRKGWWAIPFEQRRFYDEGEFLGQDGFEALNTLKYMGFAVHEDVFTKMRKLAKKGRQSKHENKETY
jgi:hypothetical protein